MSLDKTANSHQIVAMAAADDCRGDHLSLASVNANGDKNRSVCLPQTHDGSSLFIQDNKDGESSSSQNVQVILRVRPLTFAYHTGSNGLGHQLTTEIMSEAENKS